MKVFKTGRSEDCKCHREVPSLPWWSTPVILLSLVILSSGCATSTLWKHTAAREWRPQSPPDQFLATTTAGQYDAVVVFRQSATVGEKSRSRVVAWKLPHPVAELFVGWNSLRRLTNTCDRVQLMPVFSPDAIPVDATSRPPGYVVLDSSGSRFTVHLDGLPCEPFELPVSPQRRATLMRVAVAPFAIATDAAIIGTLLGIEGLGAVPY